MRRKIAAWTLATLLTVGLLALAGCSSSNSSSSADSSSGSSSTSESSSKSKAPKYSTILQSFTRYYQDGKSTKTEFEFENGAIKSEKVTQDDGSTEVAYANFDDIGMPGSEIINGVRYDFAGVNNEKGFPTERTVRGSAVTYRLEYYDHNIPSSQSIYHSYDDALVMRIEYDKSGYIANITNSSGELSTYTYKRNDDWEIVSLKIETKSGGSSVAKLYTVKTDAAGNIIELVDPEGFKVYEAQYKEMPEALDYTKIMYGYPLEFLG